MTTSSTPPWDFIDVFENESHLLTDDNESYTIDPFKLEEEEMEVNEEILFPHEATPKNSLANNLSTAFDVFENESHLLKNDNEAYNIDPFKLEEEEMEVKEEILFPHEATPKNSQPNNLFTAFENEEPLGPLNSHDGSTNLKVIDSPEEGTLLTNFPMIKQPLDPSNAQDGSTNDSIKLRPLNIVLDRIVSTDFCMIKQPLDPSNAQDGSTNQLEVIDPESAQRFANKIADNICHIYAIKEGKVISSVFLTKEQCRIDYAELYEILFPPSTDKLTIDYSQVMPSTSAATNDQQERPLSSDLFAETNENPEVNHLKSTPKKRPRPLKKCSVCDAKVKFLGSHMRKHGLSREERLQRCYEQRRRKKSKSVSINPKKCPYISCAKLPPFNRLDIHLKTKHNVKVSDAIYKENVRLYCYEGMPNQNHSAPKTAGNVPSNNKIEAKEFTIFENSRYVLEVYESLNQFENGSLTTLNDVDHAKIRNAILLSVLINNCHRPCILANMTLSQFRAVEKLEHEQENYYVISVAEHKSVKEHGPGKVTLTEHLYKAFTQYIEFVRPLILKRVSNAQIKSSENVFITYSGANITRNDVISGIQHVWKKAGLRSRILSSDLQKTITTKIHSTKEQPEKELVDWQLAHHLSTAKQKYKFRTRNMESVKATKLIHETLFDITQCKNEASTSEPNVIIDDSVNTQNEIVFPSEDFEPVSKGRSFYTIHERSLLKKVFLNYVKDGQVPSAKAIRSSLSNDSRLDVLKSPRKRDVTKIKGCLQNFKNKALRGNL